MRCAPPVDVLVDAVPMHSRARLVTSPAGSSNGRTPDSGSGSLGSSPSPAAKKKAPETGLFLCRGVVRSAYEPRWRGQSVDGPRRPSYSGSSLECVIVGGKWFTVLPSWLPSICCPRLERWDERPPQEEAPEEVQEGTPACAQGCARAERPPLARKAARQGDALDTPVGCEARPEPASSPCLCWTETPTAAERG